MKVFTEPRFEKSDRRLDNGTVFDGGIDDGDRFIDDLERFSTGRNFLRFSRIPELTIANVDKVFDLFPAVGRIKIVEVFGIAVRGEMISGCGRKLEIGAVLEVNTDSIVVLLPARLAGVYTVSGGSTYQHQIKPPWK